MKQKLSKVATISTEKTLAIGKTKPKLHEQDEESCPEDCAEIILKPDPEPGVNWTLILLISVLGVLILIVVIILIKVFIQKI